MEWVQTMCVFVSLILSHKKVSDNTYLRVIVTRSLAILSQVNHNYILFLVTINSIYLQNNQARRHFRFTLVCYGCTWIICITQTMNAIGFFHYILPFLESWHLYTCRSPSPIYLMHTQYYAYKSTCIGILSIPNEAR